MPADSPPDPTGAAASPDVIDLPLVRAPAGEPDRRTPADEPTRRTTADSGSRRRKRSRARALSPTPAERRAELVAAAAAISSGAPTNAERERVSRRRIVARRAVALVAIAALPVSVSVMVMADAQGTPLSQADAKFMSGQLLKADQRVRNQLAHLDERGTAAARSRTRDALAATRSWEIVLRGSGGQRVDQLRRALQLQTHWLGAVGSTLANPRSELRDELVTRDAALREALAELPQSGRGGVNGVRRLIAYAKSREQARAGREVVAAAGAPAP